MKPVRLAGFLMVVMMLAALGCTHNLTKLTDDQVYSRTSEAHTARMTPDGNMQSSYHGLGQTQLMEDKGGIWLQTHNTGGVISIPLADKQPAMAYSPQNMEAETVTYTPVPKEGEPMLTVSGLKVNVSEPSSVQLQSVTNALPILEGMTKAEAEATVRKWEEAGKMAPGVIELLKLWVESAFPAASVVTP